MLNIKGAYVIIGSKEPFAVILSADQDALYEARISVVGYAKAIAYTFGHMATNAVPCTLASMEQIALGFRGSHEAKVRQICARIALGQPLGDGKDYSDGGGQHARIDAPIPKPVAPSEVLARHGFTSQE